MSSAHFADAQALAAAGVDLVLDAKPRDLGGFSVRRALPAVARRAVGPFLFFDHFGPVAFAPGEGVDVRPHPHVGLATVTYLYEGEIFHRDSLGSAEAIQPGDVNWMTAGRGIVHSERTRPELRAQGCRSHGLQLWVALPAAHEDEEPSFHHYPAASLPAVELGGARLRVLAGTAYGATSPVRTLSSLFYVDVALPRGTSLAAPDEHEERAIYVVSGPVVVAGLSFATGTMLVLARGAAVRMESGESDAQVVILGGAPLDGPRHIEWNFVATSKERLELAKRRWAEGGFPKVPGDEIEFIPLPA